VYYEDKGSFLAPWPGLTVVDNNMTQFFGQLKSTVRLKTSLSASCYTNSDWQTTCLILASCLVKQSWVS